MITADKITEIFCATDEFSKKFDKEVAKKASSEFHRQGSPPSSCLALR